MSQLLLLLAVAAALTLGETPGAALLGGPGVRLGIAVGGGLLLLLALGAAFVLARGVRRAGDDDETAAWIVAYDRAQRLHFLLWAGYVLLLLVGLGWGPLIRDGWGLAAWPLIDEIVILVPILLPPLAAWAAWHEVELSLEDRLGPLGPPLPRSKVEYLGEQLRGPLAIALVPILAFVALYDLARLWLGEAALLAHGWLLGPPLVLLAILLLPAWIKQLWRVEPLSDGPLRRRLVRRAEAMQTPVAEICLWHAEGGVANAAVLGFLPWQRCVLLSEELLARLDEEEVEAVFAHELAHVARGHLWLRLAGVALPLVVLAVAARMAEGWAAPAVEQIAFPLAALAAVAFATGRISWWVEFDADEAACRSELTGQCDPVRAATLHAALSKLAPSPRDRASGSWLHPSLDARLAALREIVERDSSPVRPAPVA